MILLVVGANGFLGSEICDKLIEKGHTVHRGVSKKKLDTDVIIPLNGYIELNGLAKPDAILDFSNRYFGSPNKDQLNLMKETILGVTATLVRTNKDWSVPIYVGSSYFQYAPPNLSPWNDYAAIKNSALASLTESSLSSNFKIAEFVIHDTYGDSLRSKFLDLCIKSIRSGTILNAGDGFSVINLSHLADIANFITSKIEEDSFSHKVDRYSIRAGQNYTLRELVDFIESISGVKNFVTWDSIETNQRQVKTLWDIPDARSDFRTTKKLDAWIREKLL